MKRNYDYLASVKNGNVNFEMLLNRLSEVKELKAEGLEVKSVFKFVKENNHWQHIPDVSTKELPY